MHRLFDNICFTADWNHSCPLHLQRFNVISKDFMLLFTDPANQMAYLKAIITFDLTQTLVSGMSPNAGSTDEVHLTSRKAAKNIPNFHPFGMYFFQLKLIKVYFHISAGLQSVQTIKACRLGCVLSDYDELPAAYQHELAYGVKTWLDGVSINLSTI